VTPDAFRLGTVGCEGVVASCDVRRGVVGACTLDALLGSAAERVPADVAVPEMVR
jgi:hypothetical protein